MEPTARRRILERPIPPWNPLLSKRLHLLRHAIEEPAHAERRLVVERHSPLEVVACEKAIGPQAHAADRPELVVLGLPLAYALVLEAVLELLEADLETRRRRRPIHLAAYPRSPAVVQPLEMHGVDGIF